MNTLTKDEKLGIKEYLKNSYNGLRFPYIYSTSYFRKGDLLKYTIRKFLKTKWNSILIILKIKKSNMQLRYEAYLRFCEGKNYTIVTFKKYETVMNEFADEIRKDIYEAFQSSIK